MRFESVTNNGDLRSMQKLIQLKCIFAKQLPRMPKEYIVRLLMDPHHESVMIKDNTNKILGGICYRVFSEIGMAEIVFLAIDASSQMKGNGTALMNAFKSKMIKQNITILITCADNLALGYFRKQGFYTEIAIPKMVWKDRLKEYEGSTLMECLLDETVDYLSIVKQVTKQKLALISFLKSKVTNGKVYEGLPDDFWHSASSTRLSTSSDVMTQLLKIPGLKDNFYTYEEYKELLQKPKYLDFQNKCRRVLEQLFAHESSWPFTHPVKRDEVPTYHEVIKEPMDLSTMMRRVNQGYYENRMTFEADLAKIFKNARIFNPKQSTYVKKADTLEKFAQELMEGFKNNNTLPVSNLSQINTQIKETDIQENIHWSKFEPMIVKDLTEKPKSRPRKNNRHGKNKNKRR